MYEDMTFDSIMKTMLAAVDDSWDKREGSVIYIALAPAAAQLAQLYIALNATADRGFVDTAAGDDLNKIVAERGLTRNAATYAVRKGLFYDTSGALMNVNIGSRFYGGQLVFAVTESVSTGVFKLTCETAGEAGNDYFGSLLPVDYISGLGTATLSDVLIAGEDEETDTVLRARYYTDVSSQSFGGNIADYKEKVNAISGVGGVKVAPAWNGGGTVKLTIISSDYTVPSSDLITLVQTTMDPTANAGKGYGLAPIGHVVAVVGVSGTTINITATFTLASGYVWADVSGYVATAISAYLSELAKEWADSSTLYVRISRIEAAVLAVAGIEDIQNTKINGTAANLALADDTIPVLGAVTAS